MKKYSEAIKLEARKLVRSGLTRRETGRQLGLDDRLICIWCADIPATKGKVFSKELAEKARALLKSGKTKLQASKELNVSYEWVKYHTVGIETKKHISFELETKANELVDSGMQKKEVAKTLNLNYEWVKRHTKLHNHFTLYPQKLRENVQRLSKQGFNPSFIERSFNLPKRTAGNWIAYAKRQEYLKIGDRSLVILRKLIENGYFIPRGHQIDACKILSKQLPIKMVRYIFCLETRGMP
jgi:hypothetical protein